MRRSCITRAIGASPRDEYVARLGGNGDGKGPKAEQLSVAPANFTDARAMRAITDGELFWKVTQGRRPMPAFKQKLTDEERWQLVVYIRTLAPKAQPGAPAQP